MANSNLQYAGRKLAIAAAVAALLGTEVQAAPAGAVDFSIGNVVATGTDGRARPLAKGAELNAGDRVVTNDGRAQIRFADGAYVSLQPNTDFAIREFRYEGRTDGSERGVFGLLKGAMRTVTGAIGRVNRAAYEIQTPTATIGIRGTGGLIQVFDDGRTLLVGTSGVWTLAGLDKKTVIDLPAGQAAMTFPDPSKGPEKVSAGPVLPPAPLLPKGEEPPTIVGGTGSPPMEPIAGNIAEAALASQWPIPPGTIPAGIFSNSAELMAAATAPVTLPNPNPPLVSGPGYDLSYAVGGSAPFTANEGQTIATFDAGGKLIDSNGLSGKLTLAGTHAEFGTAGGAIAWGRWTGPVASTVTAVPPQTLGPNDGLHYAVGVPAPITALAGTGTATFNLIGATSPTDGVNAPGAVSSGQLVVNLGAAPTVALQNFTFAHAGSTYVMNKAGMSITGPLTPFVGSLSGSGSFGDFVGSTGACAATICNAQVNGHFYGASASHAGFAYKVTPGFATPITGAAAFAR